MNDLGLLIRDKYEGEINSVTDEDKARLAKGEPLAYIIGWVPFLGVKIFLDSKPLIPRPETEWWTEMMLKRIHLRCCELPSNLQCTTSTPPVFARSRLASEHVSAPSSIIHVLDLCAGSGASGLAVLKHIPSAHVTFAELDPIHIETIKKSIELNELNLSRASFVTGDLFENVSGKFDIIACNPPYIPNDRMLEESVTMHEPACALYSGADGLDLIRRIAREVPTRLLPQGELWLEADIENIEIAKTLLLDGGANSAVVQNDLYELPRLVVACY